MCALILGLPGGKGLNPNPEHIETPSRFGEQWPAVQQVYAHLQ